MSTTTTQQFTPGPWGSREALQNGKRFPVIIDADGKRIARLGGNSGSGPFANAEANARLIAAAPEMLAELKRDEEALRFEGDELGCDAGNFDGGKTEYCMHCQYHRWADRIAGVIAKAEGVTIPLVLAALTVYADYAWDLMRHVA